MVGLGGNDKGGQEEGGRPLNYIEQGIGMYFRVSEKPGNTNTFKSNRVLSVNRLKGIIRQGSVGECWWHSSFPTGLLPSGKKAPS